MDQNKILITIAGIVFKRVLDYLGTLNLKLDSTQIEIENSINHHVRMVKNWSDEIVFKDLKKAKKTSEIYVKLKASLIPLRNRIDQDEDIEEIGLLDIFREDKNHIVILGQPGAGKTTSLKFICQSVFFDEEFYPNDFKIPILIKLRDYNKPLKNKNSKILIDTLYDIFSISATDENGKHYNLAYNRKEQIVIDILNDLNVLLIIDGFDEISYKKHRDIVLDELKILATKLENSRLIITSRTADYNFSFEGISEYEINPLGENQVKQFALKWLNNVELADNFILAINNSPFSDTTIRPITIAHLCAIYERVGKIPEKPKTVYRKIVNLLLEEWDEQRNIQRVSNYAKFETDRKFDFLSNLSFHLTGRFSRTTFSKQDILNVYSKIYQDFDLKSNEANKVVNELESHSGLFLQSGYDLFEFAHKSLQEYLTAEYIVRLPNIPELSIILKLPNEFAIAIAISSNPSYYFNELVQKRLKSGNLPQLFFQTFISRLIIEKPEFNRDSNIVLSSLLLYSLYLSGSSNNNQLNLFVFDSLVNGFELFMNDIFKRNTIDLLLSNYDAVSSENSSHLSNKIITFELHDSGGEKEITEFIKYPLPKILKCRESFLEN